MLRIVAKDVRVQVRLERLRRVVEGLAAGRERDSRFQLQLENQVWMCGGGGGCVEGEVWRRGLGGPISGGRFQLQLENQV